MAQGQWLRGTVKAVSSGDCLTIVGSVKSGPPPEKTITLSSLMSPRLARRDTKDEPWAWQSREYLRKKVIGKAVVFKVDYTVPSINREFGSVFLDDTNLAIDVVANGWARVKTQVNAQSEQSPYLAELLKVEEQAQSEGLGMWNKTPGAAEASIRQLPPSGVGEGSTFDALALLDECKGKAIPAIVEMVRDGSTIRVWLLPDYQFVQVYVTGIQCPSMGRRPPPVETVPEAAKSETNGGAASVPEPLTSAQRLAAANAPVEVAPDPFAREAKHFTETRVLHRDVRIVLDGVDKYNNLFGSVFYSEDDVAQDLALQLVSQGLARVVEWSAAMLEPLAKEKLKSTERQAKLDKLRLWVNFVPAPSNSVAVRDDNFTGVVIEVVSGDCVVVADDAAPEGSPAAERRINLSSIRAPKVGNPRRDEKPAPHAREAKEFLRSRLIGQKVAVQMEYTRKVAPTDGPVPAPGGERNMEFGSVFLLDKSKDAEGATVAPTANGEAPAPGINVAEMVVGRGFATVVRHRDFEERSTYYENLVAAEARATKKKAGIHSSKEPPIAHLNDVSDRNSSGKAKQFLPFLQRSGRQPAVVDYVLSGHRFKLIVPKESIAIAFSLAGVRCPGRGEPYADEAMAFMRRRISQRSVEIEVETVDKTGTFLGSLFENKVNVAVALLENGLAKLHPSFDPSRTASAADLQRAEDKAKAQKIKVWEKYDPTAEAAAAEKASTSDTKGEVLNVRVTEVVDGSRFYAQIESDTRLQSLEQQLEALKLKEKVLPPGAFAPKRGDLVLGQFTLDDSFARALVVEAPKQQTGSGSDKYEVFYVDYGNKETLPLSRLRPLEPTLASVPHQSQLCSLAHIKVPGLDEDFGVDAAQLLQETVADKKLVARVEERDNSAGRTKAQGVGPKLIVTLVDPDSSATIQSILLEAGLARLEKAGRGASKQKREALEALQEHQEVAKKERLNIWQYGDVGSDDEEEPRAWGRR